MEWICMKRIFIALTFAVPLVWVCPAQAQTQQLILGISEGTSGGLDHAQAVAKYGGLADVIGHAIKAKVKVVFAREFKQLEEGMKDGRFDFVMARPSDYPARALRDYGYHYIASAKPDGQCFIIVPKDSPLNSVKDIKGKKIALPEQISYMSRVCAAELRDQGIPIDKENVKYVREQAAVGFYIDNKFVDVGGVASYSSLAKKWEKDGNRILHKSAPQPYFPLIANKKMRPEQLDAIQADLMALPNSEAGRELLKRIGVDKFDTTSEPRMRELLKWLNL
jgi:phosphonate transport system substrate-binding protein